MNEYEVKKEFENEINNFKRLKEEKEISYKNIWDLGRELGVSDIDILKSIEDNSEIINNEERDAKQKLTDNGYEDVIVFENESYDDALIGVSHDNRAIYSFEKMVEWLMKKDNISETDAIEWIEFNTLRAIPYAGEKAPIVMYDLNF